MELLLWLEQLQIWRLQRELGTPKEEDLDQSPDEELPVSSYPLFSEPSSNLVPNLDYISSTG